MIVIVYCFLARDGERFFDRENTAIVMSVSVISIRNVHVRFTRCRRQPIRVVHFFMHSLGFDGKHADRGAAGRTVVRYG